jgi:hypothetical protein
MGTMYAAEDDAGAIAETVFRSIPVGAGLKRLSRARLAPVLMSTLACGRPLRLTSLHGHGPRRIGSTRAQLIDSEPVDYPVLTGWGQAFHDCPAAPDGVVWRARHYDDSYAFLLFGDRVRRRELRVVVPPLPLAVGRELERVLELAEQANITILD